MKNRLLQLFLILLSTIAVAHSQSAPPLLPIHASAAQKEIHHLLDAQVEAWNRGDLDAFMKGYWHAPELTFYSGGNIAQGWQAALERYQHKYQGTGNEMGKLEFRDLEIDVLSRDAAMVTGKWQLTKSDGAKPHGLFTLILKKFAPGWQIVHDHTSSADEK